MHPHQIIDLAAKGDGGLIGVGFVFDITGGAQHDDVIGLQMALDNGHADAIQAYGQIIQAAGLQAEKV